MCNLRNRWIEKYISRWNFNLPSYRLKQHEANFSSSVCVLLWKVKEVPLVNGIGQHHFINWMEYEKCITGLDVWKVDVWCFFKYEYNWDDLSTFLRRLLVNFEILITKNFSTNSFLYLISFSIPHLYWISYRWTKNWNQNWLKRIWWIDFSMNSVQIETSPFCCLFLYMIILYFHSQIHIVELVYETN